MRKNPTAAERELWKHLRKDRLAGLHFRRQHPIGPYIVDFCCVPKRLVVELDGYFHADPERAARDETRTVRLRAAGYRVLRFRNSEDFADVLAAIAQAAGVGPQLNGRRGPPPPTPPPEGRGEKSVDPSP
jgi:very-short-patch-repair endonuclease